MQNVLKQIGLNVVSLDGRLIKQMRTFIFRCYACFKTTSIMTKVFCPSCGNKTLKKVAITLNEEGKQQVHINFRKPITKKGKRVRFFSLYPSVEYLLLQLFYVIINKFLVFFTNAERWETCKQSYSMRRSAST